VTVEAKATGTIAPECQAHPAPRLGRAPGSIHRSRAHGDVDELLCAGDAVYRPRAA
jgi:hypothetical protein